MLTERRHRRHPARHMRCFTDVTNFLALGVKKGPEGGHGEERGDTGAEGAAGKRDFGSLTTSVYTSTSLSTSPSQADPGLQYAGPVLSRVVPRNLTSLPCSVIKLSSLSHSNQSPSFDSVSSCQYSRTLTFFLGR